MTDEEGDGGRGRPAGLTDRSDDPPSALGPLLGLRRPRYEILDDELSWFYEGGEDLVLFVNLGTALRQLFSEWAVAQLSRSEMQRRPRMLAAELVNLGGHYRNYGWKRFRCRTTVMFYHSTKRCPAKLAVHDGYKENYYVKRVDTVSGEYELVRRYVDFNLAVAKHLLDHVPNMHLVDTGELDPEAWPWALMAEGRVPGPAIVMSGWAADLQYALAAGGRRGVLLAKGDYTAAVNGDNLFSHVLRKAKTGEDLAARLDPGHYMYVLGLAGDADLDAPGIRKFGAARAAKLVADRRGEGRLPSDFPSLQSLLEDGKVPDGQEDAVRRAWGLLCHQDYCLEHATPAAMSAIESRMVNRSGLGALEDANRKYFSNHPLNLDMVYAGESGY
jgi:hypothetical protein